MKFSWEKIEEVLHRLQAKWNGKIQEYIDRQQPPPIHQASICAGFRDSGKESQVYLMACVMVHFKDQMKKDMTPDEFNKMMSHWRLGHLDGKLFPEVVAMRPDFSLTDLGLRMQQEEAVTNLAVLQSSDLLDDEATQEQVRSLTNIARSLKREQDEMRGHRVASQRHMVQTVAAEAEYQKSIAQGVESAWVEHSIYYQVSATKTLGMGQAFEHATHRTLASRLMQDVKQIPVISVINIPMLGATASSCLKAMVSHMASELQASCNLTIYLVVPPNQVVFGLGRLSKTEREDKVSAHQAAWKSEIESIPDVKLVKATALFDHESMYSDDRPLGVELWIVQAAAAEQHVFQSSVLLKRRAIPGLMSCFPRQSMKNFAKDMSFVTGGKTNGDQDLERVRAEFIPCGLVGCLSCGGIRLIGCYFHIEASSGTLVLASWRRFSHPS